MNDTDIVAFVADCLYGCDPEPMTVEDAEYTINCWKEEGIEDLPEGLTAETYAAAWNSLIGVTA